MRPGTPARSATRSSSSARRRPARPPVRPAGAPLSGSHRPGRALAPRRLPRPAQLPQPRLEAGPARSRDRAVPAHLRSTAHLRDPCAPRRHLHLRSLPLHGCEPDHDRPPLRPPRPRRPRACNPAARHPPRRRGGRSWTLGARRSDHISPGQTTGRLAEQAISRSPLSDSNRRPPSLPWKSRGGNGVHVRSLASTFALQIGHAACARSARA